MYLVIEYTDDDIVQIVSGYSANSAYNLDCSSTCTCGGRNIIAVASITNELLGLGFRHYQLPAHLKIIEAVKETDSDDICARYTLPQVDTETIVKHMLLSHYDNYYQISTLRSVIDKLTDNQKRVLYLKNNFPEFIKVKEVKEVINRLIENTREDNMIEEIDLGGKMAKIVNPYKNAKTKDDIKLLGDMVKEIAFGFHFYEGDWVDGEYQETMVDIVENIYRDKIGGMDRVCVHRNREVMPAPVL